MKNIRLASALTLLLLLVLSVPVLAADPPTSGGQPFMVVDGAWNPVPGAWAKYRVFDKTTKTNNYMYIATMQQVTHEGRPARWMEIYVITAKKEKVATRFLMEETPQGPGKPLEVIVQPEGYEPFTVPDSFLEDADQGVASDMIKVSGPKVKERRAKVGGKSMTIWEVSATDDNGKPVSAIVTEEIPPLGLVRADTAQVQMVLQKYGRNWKTCIKGEPMNFYLWITQQVGKALAQ